MTVRSARRPNGDRKEAHDLRPQGAAIAGSRSALQMPLLASAAGKEPRSQLWAIAALSRGAREDGEAGLAPSIGCWWVWLQG